MNIFLILIGSIIAYGLLVFVSFKIKGNQSLFVRVGTGIFLFGFLACLIWFYGTTIFQSIQLDFSSLSSVKGFVGSRVLGIVAIVLAWLFVFFKVFYVVIKFSSPIKTVRKELTFVIPFVVFDIAVVPCIFLLGTTGIVLGILSIFTTGLACTKLVFCVFNNKKSEVIVA